jgi:hypothetical protein
MIPDTYYPIAGLAIYFVVLVAVLLKKNNRRKIWPIALWTIGLNCLAFALIQPRYALIDILPGANIINEDIVASNAIFVGRVSLLIILGCLAWSIKKSTIKIIDFRSDITRLWLSVLIYHAIIIVSGFLNDYSSIGYEVYRILVFPLFVTTLFYTIKNDRAELVISYVRNICLMIIYGSLITGILTPVWATNTGIVLIGSLYRLTGLASNPNGLGPIAAMYLGLELIGRSTKSFSIWIHRLTAMIVILWSGCKTIWISVILAAFVIAIINFNFRKRLLIWTCSILFFCASFGLFMGEQSSKLIGSYWFEQKDNISSATGRTYAWNACIEEWKRNPFWGYGPRLWGEEYRSRYFGDEHAGPKQSHNQILHALAETGLIGTIIVIFYLIMLLRCGWKSRRISNGASLFLVIILFVRCLTEVPLSTSNLDTTFLYNALLFALLYHWVPAQLLTDIDKRKTLTALGSVPCSVIVQHASCKN